jgi:hypothetical protein
MIDVTIAIVNWNTREMLRACLESLAAGVDDVPVKVVVVDNGSHDGSVEMVSACSPPVLLIANRENLGFACGNNQAYAHADGRYFMLLNPDTIVRPGAIGAMVRFLDSHPQAAGVTCRLLNLDGSFQRYYKRLPAWRYVLATHTILHTLFPDNRWTKEFYMAEEAFDQVVAVEQPPAACLMLRRDLLPRHAVFDERFPILFNDIDLCRSLLEQGQMLFFLPAAEIVHHGSGGGVGQMKDEAIIDYLICLVRYYRKRQGPFAAVVLWMILTVNSLLVLLVGLLKIASGRRDWAHFRHECRRRMRLFAGREMFRYPRGFRMRMM